MNTTRRPLALKTWTACAVQVRPGIVARVKMSASDVTAVLLMSAVGLLGLAVSVSADGTISTLGEGAGETRNAQGLAADFETGRVYVADGSNDRVDVFGPDGAFELAFGWGVSDGSDELQTCGPAASPPTVACRKGLVGGGAGQFSEPVGIAVDNSTGPSQHDVYVIDRDGEGSSRGERVEKFTAGGEFLLAWGGGVVTGGAAGKGDLEVGSKVVTNVQTTKKAFELGQTVSSPSLPPDTKIVAVGAGTMTLSRAATASESGSPLVVAEGPENHPVNQIDKLVNVGEGSPNFLITTPDPSPTESELGQLPNGTTGPQLQEALEALPNVGAGNVKVTGATVSGPVHEYTVAFTGSRFSDTNVRVEPANSLGNRDVVTIQNGDSGAEVCGVSIAASCSGGVEGVGAGRIAREARITVGPTGLPFLVDCGAIRQQDESELCQDRIQKFDPSGVSLETLLLSHSTPPIGLAVASTGDFYVSYSTEADRYNPAGESLGQLPVSGNIGALSIDGADDLFVAEEDGGHPVIAEYGPSGEILRRFGYGVLGGRPTGLAPHQLTPAGPADSVYSAETSGVLLRSFPSPGPIVVPAPCKTSFLGNSGVTLQGEVNPEGKATSVQFEYVDQKSFETEGGFASSHTRKTGSESIGSDFLAHEVTIQAAPLVPETHYHCRAVASNADAPTGIKGAEGAFLTKAPLEIGSTTVSAVGTETATLNATVDPLGIAKTTGHFEYVDEAVYLKDIAELGPEHGFDHAIKLPAEGAEPVEFGAGEAFALGSAEVSGLKPATSYRFRLLATDSLLAPREVIGPVETFRTFGASIEGLPDGRVWELVSPGLKNSAEVAEPGTAAGTFEDSSIRIQSGAGSGEAVTYTSFTSFAEAESAPAVSQYLSKRTQGGWVTQNISPPGHVLQAGFPPFTGFTPELGFAAVKVDEPALAGCPAGEANLYLRDNTSGVLHCLSSETPSGGIVCFVYAGAGEDGNHAFFASTADYAGAEPGAEPGRDMNLYEWSAGRGLQPVNVLPGESKPAPPTIQTSFGALGSPAANEDCPTTGQRTLHHVVSADGSKVFWTYQPEGKAPSRLFARIDGAETVQLDALPGNVSTKGPGPAGNGLFKAASSDGSVVYFTDTSRLVKGSQAKEGSPDLYRYQFGQSEPLTDVTKGALADVQGVLGASDDGAYIYFVAQGVLSEAETATGEKAVEGKDNLYLYHEGEALRFIATLSQEDQTDWETEPRDLTSHVSPDGRHLAFLSLEARRLAGYDNTVGGGEHCRIPTLREQGLVGGILCPQAFLYDAQANALTCASCNPSGARPLGPTTLPTWTNPYEGPRYVSEDGSKLFFESYDALSDADGNGNRDVYEFERAGSGSCTSQNPAFDPVANGCHFLISNGKSTDESYLVDASADGRDVFFSTRSALLKSDPNENYDVYDAREGGGFPEPLEPTVCEGETTCRGLQTPQPSIFGPPTSATLTDPGNLTPSVGLMDKSKPLTRAQLLRKALRACAQKKSKRKRVDCRAKAQRRYAVKIKKHARVNSKRGAGR